MQRLSNKGRLIIAFIGFIDHALSQISKALLNAALRGPVMSQNKHLKDINTEEKTVWANVVFLLATPLLA